MPANTMTTAAATALVLRFNPEYGPVIAAGQMPEEEILLRAKQLHDNWIAPTPTTLEPPAPPECDLSLGVEKKYPERFLRTLDDTFDRDTLRPRRPHEDPAPVARAWTFIIRDDAEGREDPTLRVTLVGPLDRHFKALAQLNSERRAGVYVELETEKALVAHFGLGMPEQHGHGARVPGLPLAPSIVIYTGVVTQTAIWLLESTRPEPLSIDRRKVLAERLEAYGGTVVTDSTARVRLAGFHNRRGKPHQVSALGNLGCGTECSRYSLADLDANFTERAATYARHPHLGFQW